MRQVQAGSVAAFETLVERYWSPTALYTQHLLRDPDCAADITQEAFARLWQRRGEWRATGSVRVWLLRTARNLVIGEARKKDVRLRLSESAALEVLSRPPTPLQEVERAELRDAIERAVETLSPRRREVFTLFHLQDLSYREVADIMDIRPQTVANYLQAALADLRRSLAPFFPALRRSDATHR